MSFRRPPLEVRTIETTQCKEVQGGEFNNVHNKHLANWSVFFIYFSANTADVWLLLFWLTLRYPVNIPHHPVVCYLFPLSSCIPGPVGVSGRHHGEVWNLGHRRAGAIPQSGSYVLPWSPGCHRCLWYNQTGKLFHLPGNCVLLHKVHIKNVVL